MASIASHIVPMKEMEFDIYFDESGKFIFANESWLIGGYLRPRDGRNVDKQAKHWWRNVLSAVDQKFPDHNSDQYVLAHCSENRGNSSLRNALQPMVLDILNDRIRADNGLPVIFFSPAGPSTGLAELNYINLLTDGYAELITRLQALYPNTRVRVYPHLSHRSDLEEQQWLPKGDDKDILQYYSLLMKKSASNRCRYDDLEKALNDLEIITNKTRPCITRLGRILNDSEEITQITFNLHNTIADYFCNSYYTNMADCRTGIFKDAIVINIPRQKGPEAAPASTPAEPAAAPIESEPAEPKQPEPTADEPKPEEMVQYFLSAKTMASFNAASQERQRELIARLAEALQPAVMHQQDMDRAFADIESLLPACALVESASIRAELQGNLLLFKIAILNHWGRIDQTEALAGDLIQTLNGIEEDSIRNDLVAMFFNRQIVVHTDLFDYSKADKYFCRMQDYWEKHLSALKQCSADNLAPRLSGVMRVEYGRSIGSALQLIRHRLRLTDGADRFAIYAESLKLARLAALYMPDNKDLTRLEQTMSNVESEAGFNGPAFIHLLKAASLLMNEAWQKEHADALNNIDTGEAVSDIRCAAILSVVGRREEKSVTLFEPFILSHYLRLACEMRISSDIRDQRRADIMFSALVRYAGALEPGSYDIIYSIHPRTQILWKLGSLAARSDMAKQGGRLMRAAFDQLSATGASVFQAIAIAIGAEYIALQLSGADEMLKKLRALYARFRCDKPLSMRDPFADCGVNTPLLGGEFTAEDMMKISRVIAY